MFLLHSFLLLICSIKITFIDDGDPAYGTRGSREAMIREGKINFKTCYSKVLIPASYFVRLAFAQRSACNVSGPTNFCDAVDSWLLCEVLNAIGNHTMA